MHIFGGRFCMIEGFNITSHEEFSMPCRCCACVDMIALNDSMDTRDITCTEGRPNFQTLSDALLTVFQVSCEKSIHEY